MMALVTQTSYEVIFYANYHGKILQSNELAERGILSAAFVDEIYEQAAAVVRNDKKFAPDKMNVIKYSSCSVKAEYYERNCKTYALKKRWKEEIGV